MTETSFDFDYKGYMHRHKHTWGEDGRCVCGAERCGVIVLKNAKEHSLGQCTGGTRPGHSYCKKHLYVERFRMKPVRHDCEYPHVA